MTQIKAPDLPFADIAAMLIATIHTDSRGAYRMHDGSRRLVAVVDDDDAVRDSLRFLLEISGYDVVTYGSGAEFLKEARVGELACLIVDQHMPQQTGLELIGRLRRQGATLPVALITGSPSPDLIRQARELDVSQVMEKPLNDETLLDFIEQTADW